MSPGERPVLAGRCVVAGNSDVRNSYFAGASGGLRGSTELAEVPRSDDKSQNFSTKPAARPEQFHQEIAMQLGMIGLGRMGANMVRRLLRDKHECVAFDRNPPIVQELVKDGAVGAASLKELVDK